jgi:hypothetical protein
MNSHKISYTTPKYQEKQFNCIHCGVFASQAWDNLLIHKTKSTLEASSIKYCKCEHCNKISYWYQERMVIPSDSPVPPPHPDMPEDIVIDYNEARSIFSRSPRSSAALLRLVVQKLMPLLGEKGKKINDSIQSLVAKGLPAQVQQALDYCRVVGNNAVHPGEINIKDSPDIAQHLFSMINFIVEDRITKPKQIKALFNSLPQSAIEAIAKRDGSTNEHIP